MASRKFQGDPTTTPSNNKMNEFLVTVFFLSKFKFKIFLFNYFVCSFFINRKYFSKPFFFISLNLLKKQSTVRRVLRVEF